MLISWGRSYASAGLRARKRTALEAHDSSTLRVAVNRMR